MNGLYNNYNAQTVGVDVYYFFINKKIHNIHYHNNVR